jgi:phosphoribosyl 1,2-cyclic phosphate phosphodiesterase
MTAMDSWQIVITGCGTSHGNPAWGYPEAWSDDPRDLRRRSGAILTGPDGQVLLFDAGPDLMHQLRDPDRTWDGRGYPELCVTRCDGVLITHVHADHAHGLNDLRHLNRLMHGRPIPIYGHASHLDELMEMFPYCFGSKDEFYFQGLPGLVTAPLLDDQPFAIAGLPVTPFAMSHGPAGRTTGYRCGGLGYLTDLKELPAATDALLAGLDLLVLDMLQEDPHPTHVNWDEAQAIIARLKPKRTVLVHMGYDIRYRDWESRLPKGVTMAYDGMKLSFAVTG